MLKRILRLKGSDFFALLMIFIGLSFIVSTLIAQYWSSDAGVITLVVIWLGTCWLVKKRIHSEEKCDD